MKRSGIDKEIPLPNELMLLGRGDKTNHQSWVDIENRDMLNFPSPFRIALCGGVNSGKSTIIKNIILRKNYTKLYIIHAGGEHTKDYDHFGRKNIKFLKSALPVEEMVELIGEPNPEEEKRACIILEDLVFKGMKRDEISNYISLFNYVSTHTGSDIFVTAQYFSNIPPQIREQCNVFVLWKMKSLDALSDLCRKVGIDKDTVKQLMKMLKGRDSLWLDFTTDSPYPIRINGYQQVLIDDDSDSSS